MPSVLLVGATGLLGR